MRGKMTPKTALLHTHKAPKEVKQIFDTIEGREDRVELNLYVVGYEDDPTQLHAPHTDEPTPLHPEAASSSENASA